MTSASTSVEIQGQRGAWVALVAVSALVGLFVFVLGLGLLITDGFGLAERIVLGVGGIIGGALLLLGARASVRMARARPVLRVEPDAFTLDHPGLLRLPLVVSRGEVAEVCVGDTSLGDAALAPSSEILPNLSTPLRTSTQVPNVLVVFRDRYDLDGLPRRSVPALAFFADRFGSYEGPSRGGVIHGLVFGTIRPDELRRAFAAWAVVVDTPSQAALVWVSPDQLRQRFKR